MWKLRVEFASVGLPLRLIPRAFDMPWLEANNRRLLENPTPVVRKNSVRPGLVPRMNPPTILSGAKLRLHVRSRRFVRGEGPRTCRARRKSSALPVGPTERGGPPPLLGLSPGLCGPR
jgi:hypothetical protein